MAWQVPELSQRAKPVESMIPSTSDAILPRKLFTVVTVLQHNNSGTQVNAREFKFLVWDCLILHINIHVAQSSEKCLSPLRSWVQSSHKARDTHVRSYSVVGLFRVLQLAKVVEVVKYL